MVGKPGGPEGGEAESVCVHTIDAFERPFLKLASSA